MNGRYHNNSIHLRVNDRLLAAAEAKARAKGVSLSELVRQAVGREVQGASIRGAKVSQALSGKAA